MMPVLRVSDKTWERLKGYAKPLEDTADDVVNRALDALDAKGGIIPIATKEAVQPKAIAKNLGRKLPQKEFRLPLIETLAGLNGRAAVRQIREAMEPKMKPRLSQADYKLVSTGEPRWWNAVCWERSNLVKEGLFSKASDRGIWELSEKGFQFYRKLDR